MLLTIGLRNMMFLNVLILEGKRLTGQESLNLIWFYTQRGANQNGGNF